MVFVFKMKFLIDKKKKNDFIYQNIITFVYIFFDPKVVT